MFQVAKILQKHIHTFHFRKKSKFKEIIAKIYCPYMYSSGSRQEKNVFFKMFIDNGTSVFLSFMAELVSKGVFVLTALKSNYSKILKSGLFYPAALNTLRQKIVNFRSNMIKKVVQ